MEAGEKMIMRSDYESTMGVCDICVIGKNYLSV